MLYKPSRGKFKDNCVFWHDGRFYLYSMYRKEDGDYRNIWLAESDDGAHWRDVGPVVEDADFLIWAMSVHRAGDRFILNHGSFGREGAQNVLKFWQSCNLRDWEYMGEEFDVSPAGLGLPDGARLDAMNVFMSGGEYFGYATGPAGFLFSTDGLRWRFLDTKIEFGETPPPPAPASEGVFEVGGCGEIGGRTYYLGGWFNYMGRKGYGVYTLRADSPRGPFRPDAAAYRLSGNTGRWVSLWARLCRAGTETLVNGYMQQGYGYENGDTWMPPLKKAVVDGGGHLRLAYWKGNDALEGRELNLIGERWTALRTIPSGTSAAELIARRDNRGVEVAAGEYPSLVHWPGEVTVAILSARPDAGTGFIVTGTMRAGCADARLVSPSAGVVMEEGDGFGTAIWLHGYGLTEIGRMRWSEGYEFVCEDTVGAGCAAPAGIAMDEPHRFRLLVRKNMFEFYLDDRLVQTYNTTHFPDRDGLAPRRIGFAAANGTCAIDDLKIHQMSLGSGGTDGEAAV